MTIGDPRAAPPVRIAGAQLPNVVGDLDGNAQRILDAMRWAEDQEADVLVFPELALTGYALADLVLRDDFVERSRETIEELARQAGSVTSIVGTVDRVPPRRSWDTRERTVAIACAVLCDGQIRGVYHKILLPNYEVFDEARNFAPGERPDAVWRIGEVLAGISICEDMWSGDGPPEAQCAAGARILLVPNASPFHREKPIGRHALVTEVARRNGVPVVYVNCVGGQDELVFDGGSLVVDASGEMVFRAAQFETELFCVDVLPGAERLSTGPVTTVHTRPSRRRAPLPRPQVRPSAPDDEQVWSALVLGTRDFAHRNGWRTGSVALSGGIDAAVTAAVAADALGAENVLGLAMPAPDSSEEELEDAELLAAGLGIRFMVAALDVVLAGASAALAGEGAGDGREVTGDGREAEDPTLEAQMRTAMLWAISERLGHLPLATGNKTELSVGSAVGRGDMAGAFAPLKDCPKTLVYRLARLRNRRGPAIPQRTLDRTPTARLDDMDGLPSYDVLDPIVERYLEKGEVIEALVADGFEPALVRRVLQLVDDAELERRQVPPGVRITERAFGQDLRMPITNAWRPFRTSDPATAP